MSCVLSAALTARADISKVGPVYFLTLHYKYKICNSRGGKPEILAFICLVYQETYL